MFERPGGPWIGEKPRPAPRRRSASDDGGLDLDLMWNGSSPPELETELMQPMLLAVAVAAAAVWAAPATAPSVDILAPNDALSVAAGGRRVRQCGSGSSALVVVRNVALDAPDTQLCVALAEPDGSASMQLRVADQLVQNGAEVCLPPGSAADISPALPASAALVVPLSAALPAGGAALRDWTGTLRLRAVVRSGRAAAAIAESTANLTVLVEAPRDGAAGSAAGCVGPRRFDDAAEVAGLYRLLAATRLSGTGAIAEAAGVIADAVPQSGRIATATAHAWLRAAQPRFLAPQWCAMLRHPGCIESEYAPAALPPSPYNTTADLAQGWNLRVARLASAIGRGRMALTHDGGHWSSTVSPDELAALELDLTRAQAALVDAQLVSSVLAQVALSTAPPPPPLLAIVFMTMRPGGYDVLLSSLAAQTDTRYELFCVDELAAARRKTVSAQAAALGVNLVGLQPGKERPNLPPQSGAETSAVGAKRRWRFGYANAMNTGLIGIASRHAGRSAGRIVHQTRLPCAALERW